MVVFCARTRSGDVEGGACYPAAVPGGLSKAARARAVKRCRCRRLLVQWWRSWLCRQRRSCRRLHVQWWRSGWAHQRCRGRCRGLLAQR